MEGSKGQRVGGGPEGGEGTLSPFAMADLGACEGREEGVGGRREGGGDSSLQNAGSSAEVGEYASELSR